MWTLFSITFEPFRGFAVHMPVHFTQPPSRASVQAVIFVSARYDRAFCAKKWYACIRQDFYARLTRFYVVEHLPILLIHILLLNYRSKTVSWGFTRMPRVDGTLNGLEHLSRRLGRLWNSLKPTSRL
jgi:hypothetical protein